MKPSFTRLKDFSLIVFILFLSQNLFAQGNLKFSQTRYEVLSGTTNGSTAEKFTLATQSLVVAPNHVLKVENIVGVNSITLSVTSSPAVIFTIDDVIYSRSSVLPSNGASGFLNQAFPIWLPAGTYNLKLVFLNPGGSTSYTVKAALSALDFEIIP